MELREPVVKKIKVFEKQTSGVLVREGNGIAANGSMVRIDVFCEENKGKKKYYFVPIYTADVVKKRSPSAIHRPSGVQPCNSGRVHGKHLKSHIHVLL